MEDLATLPRPIDPGAPQDPDRDPDRDFDRQAVPGHGVPSQDPDPKAQHALPPDEARREVRTVLVGGGMMAGAATGASIGIAVSGPVGVLVGGTLGAVAGAFGGAAAGAFGVGIDDVPGGTAAARVDDTVAPPMATADAQVRLHIEDSGGSGRPVVLVHGWPLSAEAWAPQVDVLKAAGFRVIAYDRRGFGRSDKPAAGYGYDALADDLHRVIDQCGLDDATLVGFSMGGGEVARLVARHGEARLRSVVFAAAVPPYLMQTADNPEGPLSAEQVRDMTVALEEDRDAFFEQFTRDFYSAAGTVRVTEPQRQQALALCRQSAQPAALACIHAFAGTDFRSDLHRLTLPTLVIHGDADAIVPLSGSGQRTHRIVRQSELVVVGGAPHGLNVSHADAFNDALLAFLRA